MAQQDDNIKKLYDELQSTYDVGSEDDFRNYLNNAEHRKALYNELKNDYDIQDEKRSMIILVISMGKRH